MDNRKLSGFSPVFTHTLKTAMKNTKYIVITAVFAILLMGGISLLIVGISEPEEKAEFDITKVAVCDKTGLGVPEYAAFIEMLEDEQLSGVEFTPCTDEEKYLEENVENTDYILVVQEENEDGFILNIITHEEGETASENLNILGESMSRYFQMFVYGNSGLSDEALTQALLGVEYSVTDIGDEEETDFGKSMVQMAVMFIFLMVVYFMILMYGQQICSEVSIEKTSKLVEQLLVSVTPYGLVSGKILAIITSSIIQFLIWIIAAIMGVCGGDMLSSMIYSGYESKISVYMGYISDWFGEMAFSPVSIVLAVLIVIVGLVFYLIIAGVAGSMVTKPEDASNVQIVFVMPLLIAFFIIIFAMTSGDGDLSLLYHLIPFTAAMVTPGAVLLGDVSILVGIISLIITVAGCVVLLYVAARVYKALLFFTGKKVSLKGVFGKKNSAK